MALLLWLLAALVPCLLGMGALCILYRSRTAQEMSLADCVLTGGMICIGLAEAAHLTAVVLGWSFSRCVIVFFAAVIFLCAAALLLLWLHRGKRFGGSRLDGNRPQIAGGSRIVWALFAAVVIVQLIYVSTMQSVYIAGDMTLETVNSFLESDAVYRMNPLTGNAYTPGMPFRLKILCLPTLYGSLCQGFGIEPELLIYGMVPALMLIGSYLAYITVARYFFPGDLAKQGLFMLVVAVLFQAGDYAFGMEGFGLLHSGFRGVVIRGTILLPYTFGLMLRKKYCLVILCILAEACIVWTLYGMGACFLVAAGLLFLGFVMRRYRQKADGEEDAVCRNS